MAGYTRQSAGNIVAGQPITATPLNNEFDAIQTAFSAGSGHTHDGSTGSAPKINLTTSVSGILPVANGGTGLSTIAGFVTLTGTQTISGIKTFTSRINVGNSSSTVDGDIVLRFDIDRLWDVRQRGNDGACILSFENTTGKAIGFSNDATWAQHNIVLSPSASGAYIELNAVRVSTVSGIETLTNKTLTTPTINNPTISSGTLLNNFSGTPVYTGQATYSVSNATTLTTYMSFFPTDRGAGKPELKIIKTATANKWNISLDDGLGNSGIINFDCGTLTFGDVPIITTTSTSTLTNKTLTSPTINGATLTGTLSGGTVNPTTLQQGGSQAYVRSNILATVSQSAGVPTGGVIERGSNVNGEYVRYADGTQICTFLDSTGLSTTDAVGSIFRCVTPGTWTFPAAFISTPISTGSADSVGVRWMNVRSTSAAAASYWQFSASTSATLIPVWLQAVGRWF